MKNRMKIVNLRLNEEIIKKLDEISSKLLISRSELIRQLNNIFNVIGKLRGRVHIRKL